MFSIAQIEAAHAKVSSGADFPAYIQEIKRLGVISFRFSVRDGQESFQGKQGYEQASEAKYPVLAIQPTVDLPGFSKELIDHQEGKTDFPHFVQICAETGIAYWIVDLQAMKCIYFDLNDQEVLREQVLTLNEESSDYEE